MGLRLIWHRVTHWEYWPFKLIYYPLFPVWLFLSAKARSLFFFNAANPSMKNGGMAMESKMEIYKKIPSEYIPKTLFVKKESTLEGILSRMRQAHIEFPCFVKPDIGMKAFGVKKIISENELAYYLKKAPADFLVQGLIPFENEIGIFYVRMPGEKLGKITGMVKKEFLTIIGNGVDDIATLIRKNPRSHLQLKTLQRSLGDQLHLILKKDEQFVLVPYGSHTRGAKFVDVTHQKTPQLEGLLNTICTRIDGFYYGRLDILYNSFEELCEGRNFGIVEVNGAGSEATHVYDPKHSLFFAWREITRHWSLLCNVSIINHKRGYPYLSYGAGRAMLKDNQAHQAQIKMI